MTSGPSTEGGFLRTAARIAIAVGAVGSAALTIREGTTKQPVLLVLFVLWVISPFAALAWANVASKDWSPLTRTTLFSVTLLITVFALVVYGGLVHPPPGSARAFVYVIVPPLSWLAIATLVPLAAFVSRRQPPPRTGA